MKRSLGTLSVSTLLLAVGAWTLSSTDAAAAAASSASVGWTTTAPGVLRVDAVAQEIAAAGFGESAFAISNCTYYNNANHTHVVGQFGYDCCNNPVSWGRKTAYKECGGCFPCFPPPFEATVSADAGETAATPADTLPVEALAAGVPAAAFAISNCTYYNNANHTHVVGQFGYDCCNNPVAWGRKTAYKECGGCFPCFPPPL